MSEAGASHKSGWWREVLIAFVVGFFVAASYSAKLTRVERRMEQAEAQLKQTKELIKNGVKEGVLAPPSGFVIDSPRELVCPDGTKLQPFVSLEEFMKEGNAQRTDWECVGKPKQVQSPPPATQKVNP
jgi:hypothetical protein